MPAPRPTPRHAPVVQPVRLLVGLLVAHAAVPSLAHAYIDPISGSIIIQALIAGVLGAILSIKRVGTAVREFFSRTWKRLTG